MGEFIMIFCYVILLVLVGLILASHSLETTEKVGGCFLAFILVISIFVSSAFIEEKGKAVALRAVGCREYTKSELYVMSEMQKDQLPKTYDLSKGTIYWKVDEQDTK